MNVAPQSAPADIEMSLSAAGAWEYAAHQPTEEMGLDDAAFDVPLLDTMSEEDFAQAYDAAMNDPMWHAQDGERYEALFLTADEQLFGRIGDAPEFPAPTEEENFGAFPGAVSESEVLDMVEASSPQAGDEQGSDSPGSRTPAQSYSAEVPDRVPTNYVGTDFWNDDRIRVPSPSQLSVFPRRVVGALSHSGNVGSESCTGSKIGPRAVLTASHCIQPLEGAPAVSGRFNPGQTNAAAVNGSIPWAGMFWRDWRINRRSDYAVLFLQDSQAVVSLGHFGALWGNDAAFYNGLQVGNMGYPCGPNVVNCDTILDQRCDDSPRVDKRCDGWMYSDSEYLGPYSYSNNDTLTFYNDISMGHSGSAITSGLAVLAVAAYCGDPVNTPGVACLGPRFRRSMWNDVCGWIAQVPSAFGQHPLCN